MTYKLNFKPLNNIKMKLSYFSLLLKNYLLTSFPDLASDDVFIKERAESAAEKYSLSIQNGLHQDAASEKANQILFSGLLFSKYDLIKSVLTEEFSHIISDEQKNKFALIILQHSKEVFSNYDLSDDFATSSEYDSLYTELTGFISIYIEENGL